MRSTGPTDPAYPGPFVDGGCDSGITTFQLYAVEFMKAAIIAEGPNAAKVSPHEFAARGIAYARALTSALAAQPRPSVPTPTAAVEEFEE